MKIISILAGIILCFVNTNICAADPVSVIGGIIAAKEIVEDLDEALTARISQAAGAGEFLVEKNYRQLQMLLKNADIALKDNTNNTFDKLTEQEQAYLRTIESLMLKADGLSDDLLALESFAAMDISSLLGLLPGIDGENFLIRSIEGSSQTYQESGIYNVKFLGQAFKHDHTVSVTIDGQPIEIRPFSKAYVIKAEIPVALLNSQFDNSLVKRAKINVHSWKIDKHWFGKDEKVLLLSYSTEILLLPKYPVSYEFVQVTKGQGWGEKIYTIQGKAIAHRTGTSGKWNRYLVSVTIPEKTRMIPSKTKTWVAAGVGPGSWGKLGGQYSIFR